MKHLSSYEQRSLAWYHALPADLQQAVDHYIDTGDLRPYLLRRERLVHEHPEGLEFPLPERLDKPPLLRRK
jgi:hypothetical protein